MSTTTQQGGAKGQFVVSSSSQLMTNHAAASALDAQKHFRVSQDANGDPLVFALGTDGSLRAILRDSGGSTGWRALELTSGPLAGLVPSAFEVHQDAAGKLILAVAAAATATPADSHLYMTGPLSNDPAAPIWKDVSAAWVSRDFPSGQISITSILMGGADGQGMPLTIIAAEQAGKAAHFQVNPDVGNSAWVWKPYLLPENADHILDMAVGTVWGDQGVYSLYQVGPALTLEFTTLPDPVDGKTTSYDFPVPHGTSCIAVVPSTPQGSDDLYAAGQGLYLFAGSGSNRTTVADPSVLAEVTSLVARTDGTTVSLWAVGGDEDLSYLSGAGATWSAPLVLRPGTGQIDAMRSTVLMNDHLFFVSAGNELGYLWRDPASTLWTQTNIPLPDTGRAMTFNSFTTQVLVTDAEGQPAVAQSLAVSCSRPCYVTINGASHRVGPDLTATVPADARGTLTIITRADSLAAPVYQVSPPGSSQAAVNPSLAVIDALRPITTGSALSSATLRTGPNEGQPVFATPPSSQTADTLAHAIHQFVQLVPTGEGPPPPSPGPAGVTPLAQTTLAATSGMSWGVTLGAGDASLLQGSAALNAVAELGEAIESEAGDILRFLEHTAETVESFFVTVVHDVTAFIIKIADKVYRFLLDAYDKVVAGLDWLLKTFVAEFEKLVAWLGFIFNWQDILHTHKVIANFASWTLEYAEEKVDEFAGEVHNFFEGLKSAVASLDPGAYADQPLKSWGQAQHSSMSPLAAEGFSAMTSGPHANWGNYHLLHGGTLDVSVPTDRPADPLSAFYADVVMPAYESIKETVSKLGSDFTAAWHGDMTAAQLFEALGMDTFLGIVDVMEQVAVGFIEFIADLIDILRRALTAEIQIPLLSALYEEIAGSPLSVMDAIALIVAVPTTIVYKIFSGKTPFADTTLFDSPNTRASDVFASLGGSGKTRAETAAFASLADAAPEVDTESAAETSAGTAPKEKLSPGLMAYSHVGGVAYSILTGISDALSIVGALLKANAASAPTFDEEELEGRLFNLAAWRFGLGCGAVAMSYPVGDDEEVGLQRAVWYVDGAVELLGFGLELFAKFQKEGKIPIKIPITAIQAVKAGGVLSIAHGVTLAVMETVIFAKEMGAPNSLERTMDGLKYGQNLCYVISKGGTGATAWLDDPESAGVAAAIAGFALFLAMAVNITRTIVNIGNELEHQNF